MNNIYNVAEKKKRGAEHIVPGDFLGERFTALIKYNI
jgi:hypothetical protein